MNREFPAAPESGIALRYNTSNNHPPPPARVKHGDEVFADIRREGRMLTLPGIVRAALDPGIY